MIVPHGLDAIIARGIELSAIQIRFYILYLMSHH